MQFKKKRQVQLSGLSVARYVRIPSARIQESSSVAFMLPCPALAVLETPSTQGFLPRQISFPDHVRTKLRIRLFFIPQAHIDCSMKGHSSAYIYMCGMHVCLYMCVSADVSRSFKCACACMQARGWCWVSSSISLHLLWQSRASYLNSEVNDSARLASQLALGPPCLHLAMVLQMVFTHKLGIQTPILTVVWQVFCSLIHLLSPHERFLQNICWELG